ncbi:SRPBCC family protein [Sphingopyxis terrae]|uniref:Polyketide cyclase / dehydrase and lipid transport n=1 Tax=Sphingopyxis terrae subsp. ummariensis TaxID=429001 RepID=A0A1Y6FVF9_9SPHN|nr:hypothetical protein [Sphingopyxis terrae]PCF90293.1 hypothetical protein CPA46_16115 [Sphingopyxis terrae subsp. ummariensis]SMQ79252.1 hypothetical protein SAMN06295984_3199 [Sphingopyxis terrae subsp. ummariensis]
MHVKSSFGALLFAATCVASPAAAKVIDQSDIGFTVAHTAQVAATPEDVWKMLRTPDKWWSKEHSWSGDAANFWLDSQAGGCFCEKLPDEGQGVGSVQHARIIFAKPGEMMRLSGAFGPLQGEAVTGTLTIQIKKTPTGSAIRFDYVVGGYMRFKVADIVPAVDKVLAEQMVGLANALGGSLPVARGDKPAEDKSGEGADEAARPADSNADADGAAEEPAPADSGLDAAVADLVKDEPKRD